MPDERDEFRDAVHDVVQQRAPKGADAILVGWSLVAEWVDPAGGRWLTREQAESTTQWAAKGMHHEALYGDWDDPPGN
jgi:hypothetical protein